MPTYELRPPAGQPADFKIPYEDELNPQQLAVVTAGAGPMLVIAGAGSGKTRVVTYRVARLVETGVDPASLLLVTFTNKAAREMLHRVARLLGVEPRRIWGGTFHHIGNLILRRHARQVGLTESYGILDREDSKTLLEDCVDRLGLARQGVRFPKGDVLLEILSLALNTAVPPATLVERQYATLLPRLEDVLRVFAAYASRKREQNVVDFDDLLVLWHRLLTEDRAARESWGGRFRSILVDEYQDTNRLQGEIVDALASVHRNLTVVGDDAQSIYSFRGAHFENILDFPKRYADAQVFRLETNYRSTPRILALANASISHNVRQFQKALRAVRPDGPAPALVAAQDADEQARFVVQRMLDLHHQVAPLRELAVLYRAHYQSLELQLEMTRSGIPFQIRSGLRFFEQAHIKDVVAYLKIVVNPRDELAWKRVIRLYPRLGRAAAETIWGRLAASPDPLAEARGEAIPKALPRGGAAGWKALAATLARLAAPPLRDRPAEMIETVLKDGYEELAQSTFQNAANRVEEIRQLGTFALRYPSADEFLSELALLSDLAGAEAPAEGDDEDDRVVLSTVHQAKGLEWRAVFVIGLVDGLFPLARCLREAGGEEEERRLFYVAVTRAKDELHLVYPVITRERGTWEIVSRPSRFVQELPAEAYEKWMLTEGPSLPFDRPARPRRGAADAGGLVDSDPEYDEDGPS
jgi:DNA helicase-2/ATP-dependent DNA helicase PcrA